MRLVNTSTLKLEEFMGDYDGSYAILSHTWEKDEITCREMIQSYDTKDTDERERITSKAGYVKVRTAAEVAAKLKFEWIWIDTCCIDKTSSAELSEAINSMFRWYKKSALCIAYLADVSAEESSVSWDWRLPREVEEEFRSSRWFTRGWTLQELIAPEYLFFYSKQWVRFGSKSSRFADLSSITGIDKEVLRYPASDLLSIRIAIRMSWASARSTTRIEDMAYCLLGLFDVNMPLLYGEGKNAFQRLQEEIARKSNDHSLFLWKHNLAGPDERATAFALYRGLFARSTAEFTNFRDSRGLGAYLADHFLYFPPSALTNMGLQIRLPLIPVSEARMLPLDQPLDTEDPQNEFLAYLNMVEAPPRLRRYAIQIKRMVDGQPLYVRVRPDITYLVESYETPAFTEIILQTRARVSWRHQSSRLSGFYITVKGPSFHAPFHTTLSSPVVGHVSLGDGRVPVFLPGYPASQLGSRLHGTLVRSSIDGPPIVFAFGIGVAPLASIPFVGIYETAEGEDSTAISPREAHWRAVGTGPRNFISSGPGYDSTAVTLSHGQYTSKKVWVSLSTAIKADKLVCIVDIVSSEPGEQLPNPPWSRPSRALVP